MKFLKVGIVICTLLLGVGIVGAGATLGKLYNDSQLEYNFYEEADLNVNALKKLYINTDMKVRIEETTGKPRVEVSSYYTGIRVPQPTYSLGVGVDGDTTYIDIEGSSRDGLNFFIANDGKEEAVIYLPKQDMEKLIIESNSSNWGTGVTYRGTSSIQEVSIQGVTFSDLELNGSYQKLDVDANHSTIQMHSETAADVEVNGRLDEITLTGNYRKVDLKNVHEAGKIYIESEAPYTTVIGESGYTGDVILKGALKDVEIRGSGAEVSIEPSIVPSRIKVRSYNTDVNVLLPSNIPGFQVDYQYGYQEGSNFYTNFDVSYKGIGESRQYITYGEGGTSMIIEGDSNNIFIMK